MPLPRGVVRPTLEDMVINFEGGILREREVVTRGVGGIVRGLLEILAAFLLILKTCYFGLAPIDQLCCA